MSHSGTTLVEPEAGTEKVEPRHAKPARPLPPRLSGWLRRTHWPASPIDRVFTIGRALIVCQLAWLMAFSTLLWDRGALTLDFSIYNQARWLLAHGSLDPFDTALGKGLPYWRNHGEALMWPLAQLTRLPPHGLLLLYAQDIAVAGAGWVALRWAADLARKAKLDVRVATMTLGVVTTLLLINPWVYYAAAYDFHMEPLASCFARLIAYSLYRRRPRHACGWAALTLSAGVVACLYVVGAGLGALLAGNHRKHAVFIAAAGLSWLVALTLLGANAGTSGYGYLAGASAAHASIVGQVAEGAVSHPDRLVGALWDKRADLWANLAPSGLLGLFSPWGAAMGLMVLVPSFLHTGTQVAIPSFQNFACYAFVVVGTMWVFTRIGTFKKLTSAICGAVIVLAVCWAAVWLPYYPGAWLRVTPAGGQALVVALSKVPARAQAIVSQGIAGRFSNRQFINPIVITPVDIRLSGRSVYFVLSPSQGVEIPTQETDALLAQVVNQLRARLVYHAAGIWEFRWQPPPGMRSFVLGGQGTTVAAWISPGPAGVSVIYGPPATWRAASNGHAGYVVNGDYWYLTKGDYETNIELSSTGGGDVEVWNAYYSTLLARREINPTDGPSMVHIPFVEPLAGPDEPFRGTGPFSIDPIPPPPGQQIEVRVYAPGTTDLSVYTISITHAR